MKHQHTRTDAHMEEERERGRPHTHTRARTHTHTHTHTDGGSAQHTPSAALAFRHEAKTTPPMVGLLGTDY